MVILCISSGHRIGSLIGTWTFELRSNGEDDPRAEGIVQSLRGEREVEDVGASAWRVEYFPFEDQVAAAGALHRELCAADEAWAEVLEASVPSD